jgi:formamidopyrimidine-DNA glycosylase
MTGQLIYLDKSKNKKITGGHPTLDWINKLPSKHTRVSITFDDNSKLFFNDIRVFGWLKPVSSQKELDHEQRNFKGLEPGKPEFTLTNLRGALSRTKRPVKTAIMDQALIAGVGNIYANDALWDAKVSPAKPANTLTQGELKRLRTSLVKVIKLGIKHGGATDSDYRQLNGMGGSYQKYFLTYRQTGKPCKRCQTPIKKLHLGGRGTFLCPVCQA